MPFSQSASFRCQAPPGRTEMAAIIRVRARFTAEVSLAEAQVAWSSANGDFIMSETQGLSVRMPDAQGL